MCPLEDLREHRRLRADLKPAHLHKSLSTFQKEKLKQVLDQKQTVNCLNNTDSLSAGACEERNRLPPGTLGASGSLRQLLSAYCEQVLSRDRIQQGKSYAPTNAICQHGHLRCQLYSYLHGHYGCSISTAEKINRAIYKNRLNFTTDRQPHG